LAIKNKKVKELLRLLKRDKIISEGEYQRMWNDYKQLKKKEYKENYSHQRTPSSF